MGNRLTKTTDGQTDAYIYEPGTNRLTAVEGDTPKTFTHDSNGNTLSENERSYTYNLHNRLMSVTQDDSKLAEYVYNGAGQGIKKLTQDETRVFRYDLFGHLIAETDGEGEILAEYVYLEDQPLAMICEREISERKGEKGAASCFVSQVSWGAPFWEELSTEEVIYYFHNDHLGTPQLMTDDQGVVVWKATYKPFGEVEVNSSSTVVCVGILLNQIKEPS